MSQRLTATEEQALLLADILNRVPDKLAKVQTVLQPVAQRKSAAMSVNERLLVAQACTALQFVMADVLSVVRFVSETRKPPDNSEQPMMTAAHSQQIALEKKGNELH
jgi:hypothetical protein